MISPNKINLRHVLVGHCTAVYVVDFDKKRYDIFLVKIHYVNSGTMTHQYTTQIDFIWADHVPDGNGTILTAGHHHTIIKSETEIIKVWVRINTN